jgi:hypothetical protein
MLPDLRQRMLERVERLPIFDADTYLALNPDAHPSAHAHFVDHGLRENRPFTDDARIGQFLRGASSDDPAPVRASGDDLASLYARTPRIRVGVFASSGGNFFMREIAELIVRDLTSVGVDAALHDEQGDVAARPPICIFVAPHEFFRIGRGTEWARADVLGTGFMYATEQMHTPWFRESLGFVLPARGVIDLNIQSVGLFAQAGIPALCYAPGYRFPEADNAHPPDHPLARALPDSVHAYDPFRTAWTERPLDLVFLGAESPGRERFFAENAAFFAGLQAFIYYARLSGVRRGPFKATDSETRPKLNSYLGARTKIVLNLHQGDLGYFEWHRMVVQGMWHRALVVSDPCLPHPLFKPDVHYLEETRDRLPDLIDWLLRAPDGQAEAERVRNEAFATLVEAASMRRTGLSLAGFLAANAG